MSEERPHSAPPSTSPEILSYAPPPDQPGGRIVLRTVLILLGLAIGAGGTALLGLGIWKLADESYRRTNHNAIWPVFLFAAILLASGVACFLLWRKYSRAAKWFLMGLLLGAGGFSLVEGICFLNQ